MRQQAYPHRFLSTFPQGFPLPEYSALPKLQEVAIFLLRPGVSEEEVITADDGEAIFLLAQYANVIDTEYNGDFSVEIKTNIETDKTYTLKLAGKEINKIKQQDVVGCIGRYSRIFRF